MAKVYAALPDSLARYGWHVVLSALHGGDKPATAYELAQVQQQADDELEEIIASIRDLPCLIDVSQQWGNAPELEPIAETESATAEVAVAHRSWKAPYLHVIAVLPTAGTLDLLQLAESSQAQPRNRGLALDWDRYGEPGASPEQFLQIYRENFDQVLKAVQGELREHEEVFQFYYQTAEDAVVRVDTSTWLPCAA